MPVSPIIPPDLDPRFPTEPLPLSAYPRPPADNGMGLHWSTHLYAQSNEVTDFFVNELVEMNIKWVKLLNDSTGGRHYDYTVEQLVANGIMPVIRVYERCNRLYNQAELADMVRHFVAKGVYYYDLYNEPNVQGEAGGWCGDAGSQPDPEFLAEIWAEAARTIYLAGGYPGLPSFFAPSRKLEDWQEDFFYEFFEALRDQGNEHVLYFSWGSIHNYTLNHPPTYPLDDVNLTDRLLTDEEIERYDLTEAQAAAINEARRTAREPGGYFLGDNLYDDSTGFLHFISFHDQFVDRFGFEIPLLSTEGGATWGSNEDPRYPRLDGETVADWTLWMADYMFDDAPDYYFTNMTWLLGQRAVDYFQPAWEDNAWYHNRQGDQEPVVDALKERPRRLEARPSLAD
jgi:hypothetical protein